MGSGRQMWGAGFVLAASVLSVLFATPRAKAQAVPRPSKTAQQTAQPPATHKAPDSPQPVNSGAPAALSPAAQQELRARAEQFWRLWAAGQRMKALDLVAPNSRDKFLGQPLPPVTSFHFDKILDQDKPGLEVVYVAAERPSPSPQFPGLLHSYVATVWKQVDGEWYLTMKDVAVIPGPFGPIKLNGDEADGAATRQELQQMIEQKSHQVDMKKIEEYIKTHNRIVSTQPGVVVKFAGDDHSEDQKDKKPQTPPTNTKKPAASCPPAAGDRTSACPPKP